MGRADLPTNAEIFAEAANGKVIATQDYSKITIRFQDYKITKLHTYGDAVMQYAREKYGYDNDGENER